MLEDGKWQNNADVRDMETTQKQAPEGFSERIGDSKIAISGLSLSSPEHLSLSRLRENEKNVRQSYPWV